MLSGNIKAHRLRLKMNKAALARAIDVTDVSIGYWESQAIKEIGHKKLITMAGIFGVSVSELLEDPMQSVNNSQVARRALDMVKADQYKTPSEIADELEAAQGDEQWDAKKCIEWIRLQGCKVLTYDMSNDNETEA